MLTKACIDTASIGVSASPYNDSKPSCKEQQEIESIV